MLTVVSVSKCLGLDNQGTNETPILEKAATPA